MNKIIKAKEAEIREIQNNPAETRCMALANHYKALQLPHFELTKIENDLLNARLFEITMQISTKRAEELHEQRRLISKRQVEEKRNKTILLEEMVKLKDKCMKVLGHEAECVKLYEMERFENDRRGILLIEKNRIIQRQGRIEEKIHNNNNNNN
eukprot:Tbor_TRINITY_DN4975_c4_g1::TRINITY_DN4975_c4_g1_i2::g.9948::m.9948